MHDWKRAFLRSALLSLCALLLTAGGCQNGGGGDDNAAFVRLINAAPASDNLTVSVDGRRVWRRSPFRSNTGYAGVREGTYPVQIAEGNAAAQGRSVLTCHAGEAYTVLALGSRAAGPDVRIFTDNRTAPVPSGKARVHLIQAADGPGAVDVLFNNIVGATDVLYGTRSPSLLLDAGTYDLKVNAAGDVAPLVGPVSLRLRAGRAYTLVVMGRQGATDPQQALSLEAYPDDAPEL